MDEQKGQPERDDETQRVNSKVDVRDSTEEKAISGVEIEPGVNYVYNKGTVLSLPDFIEIGEQAAFHGRQPALLASIVDATGRPVSTAPAETTAATSAEDVQKKTVEENVIRQVIDGAIADVERTREATNRDRAEIDRLRDETRSIISKLLAA